MIKTVILDWSGVVSDDWLVTFKTANDVLEEYGQPRMSMERFKELYEQPWMRFYKKLKIEVNPNRERQLWGKYFPKNSETLKPFSCAKPALEWLKEKGLKTIVLSSLNQELLEKEVIDYGFQDMIDYVDASNEDKGEKIDALLESHKAEKESTIYVGDMVHDVETANGAGIKSVAVLSGYDKKEKLEKAGADYIIEDLGELPALIEKLEGNLE